MDTEKADLNAHSGKTGFRTNNESVENSKSENRDEKDPSIHEKSADRVKEIYSSSGREPS